LARAATKRRRAGATNESPRRRTDHGEASLESTLFFSRLRRQAKWVFVLLALVFGVGFVVFGVGSDIGGGLSDVFSNIRGSGSSSPSVSDSLERTKENPKNAAAWRDLAEAYELDGQTDEAAQAWITYTKLRPRDVTGWNRLAAVYEGQAQGQTQEAQLVAIEAQTAQAASFLPPPTTPLGRALGERPNPITQAVVQNANQRYNTVIQERQATLTKLVDTYRRIGGLQPEDAAVQLQLALAAQNAGDAEAAVGAYRRFLRLAPDDPNAVYARQQLKTLEAQVAPAPRG
jgi:tetratricopeptide (TPR) repeat protein